MLCGLGPFLLEKMVPKSFCLEAKKVTVGTLSTWKMRDVGDSKLSVCPFWEPEVGKVEDRSVGGGGMWREEVM